MANLNFNKVIMGGRMTADPELKTTPGGVSVTSFTIAVNRRFGNKQDEEQQADFFNVTAWRGTAEFITKFFKKSSSICIVGSLQTRSYEKDGHKRYITEVVADEAYFVDSKSETVQTVPAVAYVPEQYTAPAPMYNAPNFETMEEDEELPF